MRTITSIIRSEIVEPAHNSLRDLTLEEFKTEIISIIKDSTFGVGRDIALFAIENVDWNLLYKQSRTTKLYDGRIK